MLAVIEVKQKEKKSDPLEQEIKVDKRQSHCTLITSQAVSKVLTAASYFELCLSNCALQEKASKMGGLCFTLHEKFSDIVLSYKMNKYLT